MTDQGGGTAFGFFTDGRDGILGKGLIEIPEFGLHSIGADVREERAYMVC